MRFAAGLRQAPEMPRFTIAHCYSEVGSIRVGKTNPKYRWRSGVPEQGHRKSVGRSGTPSAGKVNCGWNHTAWLWPSLNPMWSSPSQCRACVTQPTRLGHAPWPDGINGRGADRATWVQAQSSPRRVSSASWICACWPMSRPCAVSRLRRFYVDEPHRVLYRCWQSAWSHCRTP